MNTVTLNIANLDALQHGVRTRHQFDRKGGTIGSQGADWLLEDRDRRIAPIHCEIRWLEGSFCAIDRCNRTYLNHGSPSLGESTPVRLREGDQLQIGGYRLQVHYLADRLGERGLETLFTPARGVLETLIADVVADPFDISHAPAPADIREAFAKSLGHDPLAALDAQRLPSRELP